MLLPLAAGFSARIDKIVSVLNLCCCVSAIATGARFSKLLVFLYRFWPGWLVMR